MIESLQNEMIKSVEKFTQRTSLQLIMKRDARLPRTEAVSLKV